MNQLYVTVKIEADVPISFDVSEFNSGVMQYIKGTALPDHEFTTVEKETLEIYTHEHHSYSGEACYACIDYIANDERN